MFFHKILVFCLGASFALSAQTVPSSKETAFMSHRHESFVRQQASHSLHMVLTVAALTTAFLVKEKIQEAKKNGTPVQTLKLIQDIAPLVLKWSTADDFLMPLLTSGALTQKLSPKWFALIQTKLSTPWVQNVVVSGASAALMLLSFEFTAQVLHDSKRNLPPYAFAQTQTLWPLLVKAQHPNAHFEKIVVLMFLKNMAQNILAPKNTLYNMVRLRIKTGSFVTLVISLFAGGKIVSTVSPLALALLKKGAKQHPGWGTALGFCSALVLSSFVPKSKQDKITLFFLDQDLKEISQRLEAQSKQMMFWVQGPVKNLKIVERMLGSRSVLREKKVDVLLSQLTYVRALQSEEPQTAHEKAALKKIEQQEFNIIQALVETYVQDLNIVEAWVGRFLEQGKPLSAYFLLELEKLGRIKTFFEDFQRELRADPSLFAEMSCQMTLQEAPEVLAAKALERAVATLSDIHKLGYSEKDILKITQE